MAQASVFLSLSFPCYSFLAFLHVVRTGNPGTVSKERDYYLSAANVLWERNLNVLLAQELFTKWFKDSDSDILSVKILHAVNLPGNFTCFILHT